MIVAGGKTQLKRYLAGQAPSLAGSLALGVGAAAPTVNDVRLQFEVVRVPITSIGVDPNSDSIVFKSTIRPGQIGTVYEIGLWSSGFVESAGKTLNLLNASVPVSWTNGTLTNQNARANVNALQISYVANGTTNAELSSLAEDLSMFTDVDSMVVGYYATTNLSSVRVRLGADASNYFEFTLPAPTANSYNVARVTRSSATKTGAPDWSAISYVAVRPSATAAGSGSIFFDGIRFERNSLSDTNLLVARSVLATPTVLDTAIDSDIEYAVRVAIA